MTQWVSFDNWKCTVRQRVGPLSQEPRKLWIEFDVVNPSNFPLTLTGDFKFNGKLPGAPRLILPGLVVLPSKPLTTGVEVLLTDDQAHSFVENGSRISLHGEYSHVGPSKERCPAMEIHANIVCTSGQPTVTEFESINEKPTS